MPMPNANAAPPLLRILLMGFCWEMMFTQLSVKPLFPLLQCCIALYEIYALSVSKRRFLCFLPPLHSTTPSTITIPKSQKPAEGTGETPSSRELHLHRIAIAFWFCIELQNFRLDLRDYHFAFVFRILLYGYGSFVYALVSMNIYKIGCERVWILVFFVSFFLSHLHLHRLFSILISDG